VTTVVTVPLLQFQQACDYHHPAHQLSHEVSDQTGFQPSDKKLSNDLPAHFKHMHTCYFIRFTHFCTQQNRNINTQETWWLPDE